MIKRAVVLLFILAPFLWSAAHAETDVVYQRVMKKQSVDCGYAEWPPYLNVDANTQKVSGLMVDVWDILGKKLGLQINWVTHVGWGEVTEAVKTNKFDVFCVGVWPDAGRTKNMLLSRPVFYSPLFLYSRYDDKRFDNNYARLNDPNYTLVGQEGDLSGSILPLKFSKAKTSNVPAIAPTADNFLNVATKKADVTPQDVPNAEDFMLHNPNKIRRVAGPPIALVPTSIPLAVGEYQLNNMINAALNDLINEGAIAGLITQYKLKETYPPQADVKTTP